MFASFRAGLPVRSSGVATLLSAAALALMLGACSSSKVPQGPQVFAWMLSEPPQQAARPAAAVPVEMEDDGLPAQTAPSVRARQLPDDPSEPWSRNYGGPAPAPVAMRPDEADTPAAPAVRQDDAPGGAAADPGRAAEEGYPQPKSPEEAGVRPPEAPVRIYRGASLALPPARCARSGNGWLCTR